MYLNRVLQPYKEISIMKYKTNPIQNIEKIVQIESGVCVAREIMAPHHVGAYSQTLIIKWGRYWPKHIPENEGSTYKIKI